MLLLRYSRRLCAVVILPHESKTKPEEKNLTSGFTHKEDSATLGSDMSDLWGLPGAMLTASLFFMWQNGFGADDRIARLFPDKIARRRHLRPSATGCSRRASKALPSCAASPLFVLQSNLLKQTWKRTTHQKWCIVSKHCSFARSETGDWYNVSISYFVFSCPEKLDVARLLKRGRFIWMSESTIYGLRFRRFADELPYTVLFFR